MLGCICGKAVKEVEEYQGYGFSLFATVTDIISTTIGSAKVVKKQVGAFLFAVILSNFWWRHSRPQEALLKFQFQFFN